MKRYTFLVPILLFSAGLFYNIAAQDAQAVANGRRDLPGFDGINWGTEFTAVKQRFQEISSSGEATDPLEIVNESKDRELLVNRGGIFYRYAFYQKPEMLIEKPAEGQEQVNQGKFFLMQSNFPPILTDDLYQKLDAKYGARTSSTVNKKFQGAYVWDLAGGFLIQWVEPYQQKAYTRSLVYISKDLREEIKKDLKSYQYNREIKNLEKVLP